MQTEPVIARMYRILGADNQTYGPVPAATVTQWIAEGRLNRQSLIQAEGSSEWKPITDFPEFSSAITSPPPAPFPTEGGTSQGLATTSLILGILSLLCFGILTGIPAIVTGHIAHKRARRSPQSFGGKGMALAGLILGYLSILVTLVVLPALLLPAISQARGRATSIQCLSHMKQISLGAIIYANTHTNTFPPDFQSMSAQLVNPSILVCPLDQNSGAKTPAMGWAGLGTNNISYEYLSPGININNASPQTEVFRCPNHGHVAHLDGSVNRGPGVSR